MGVFCADFPGLIKSSLTPFWPRLFIWRLLAEPRAATRRGEVGPDVPPGLTRNLFGLAPILKANVSPDGLEPSTPSLKGMCSTGLSYGPTYDKIKIQLFKQRPAINKPGCPRGATSAIINFPIEDCGARLILNFCPLDKNPVGGPTNFLTLSKTIKNRPARGEPAKPKHPEQRSVRS